MPPCESTPWKIKIFGWKNRIIGLERKWGAERTKPSIGTSKPSAWVGMWRTEGKARTVGTAKSKAGTAKSKDWVGTEGVEEDQEDRVESDNGLKRTVIVFFLSWLNTSFSNWPKPNLKPSLMTSPKKLESPEKTASRTPTSPETNTS